MQGLVKTGRRDPVIRELSANLVLPLPAKDFQAEAETLFNFVQSNIRYTMDINDVETLHPAQWVLENGYGDCDDFSVLLASMLESIGHKCRFMAVSFDGPEDFEHVLIQTKIGNRWIAADATEPNPFGWEPPGIQYWLEWYI